MDIKIGWLCAMLDVLGKNEMSSKIKSMIKNRQEFNEGYDYELGEIQGESRRLTLMSAVGLLEQLSDRDKTFEPLFNELAKEYNGV